MKFFTGDKEKQLVKGLRNGENAAMQDLYTHYGGYLSGVCSRYIADDDNLKDVFQDTLINIITHINKFEYRGDGSFRAWATRIAANQSLMFIKSQHNAGHTSLDMDIPDEQTTKDPDVHDIPPDVIHDMIRTLPDGYRAVFNLYVFEEKSHKEIAQLLNIKEASSASQLHRAKNMLAKRIEEYRNKQHLRQ